ncbi:MAG: ABC transporter permease [Bryobacterales bacterium]|nr:ABC transporter permease [Bryobacterales bacterium]
MPFRFSDFVQAGRRLRRAPLFAVTVVCILGLGIAAFTTVFSAVWATLLRPLPYGDDSRLFALQWSDPRTPAEKSTYFTRMEAFAYSDLQTAEAVAIWHFDNFLLGDGDEREQIRAACVNSGFFSALDGRAIAGRTFFAAEHGADPADVVVLSHSFWQRKFSSDASVVGRNLLLDGKPHRVVGVMPADFQYPEYELWKPLRAIQGGNGYATIRHYHLSAKTKPGVSEGALKAELQAIAGRLSVEFPDSNRDVRVATLGFRELLYGDTPRLVSLLLGAVGAVLLIAVANLAGLFVAREAAKRRETAVRLALGAGRFHLLRLMAAESVLLGASAAFLGLLLSRWSLDAVLKLAPLELTRVDNIGIHPPVFWSAVAVVFACAALLCLAPVLRSPRALAQDMQTGGRNYSETGGHALRSTLLGAQVVLTFVLLFGAGLMIRTIWNLSAVDPGFALPQLASLGMVLSPAQFPSPESRAAHVNVLLESVSSHPAVESAAAGNFLPLWQNENMAAFQIQGDVPKSPADRPTIGTRVVTDSYFATMGVPIVAGRDFARSDALGSAPIAIINQTAARRFFGSRNPVGMQVRFSDDVTIPAVTIVGVCADVRYQSLRLAPVPEFFRPYAQDPWAYVNIVVRGRPGADPALLIAPATDAIRAVDPGKPLFAISTYRDLAAGELQLPRFMGLLLGTFALYALVLSMLGLYALISLLAARRRREFGIRRALGAPTVRLLRDAVYAPLVTTAVAIGGGILAALWLARYMEAQLFGISARDPITAALIVLMLGTGSLAAVAIPAWRAARVSPLVALREE